MDTMKKEMNSTETLQKESLYRSDFRGNTNQNGTGHCRRIRQCKTY